MGGVLGGKGSSGSSSGYSRAGEKASRIAQKYYKETAPYRQNAYNRWNQMDAGNWDVTTDVNWSPARQVLEDQYGRAKENIIANTARGGPLDEALADLSESRAQDLTGLSASILANEQQKKYGAAFGAPQTSAATLSSLASTSAMAQAQENAAKSGMTGQLGMGLGTYMGSKD